MVSQTFSVLCTDISKMAFLRNTRTAAIAATSAATVSALPFLSFSSSSSLSSNSSIRFSFSSSFLSPPPILSLVKSFSAPLSAVTMANGASVTIPPQKTIFTQQDTSLPELLTEFMVDMTCEGCVNSVRNKLQTVEGIKNVDVDLDNQVVRVLGTAPVKTLADALEQTGRKARLIGQGIPDDFLISAAVSEYKGPDIFGVVRLVQVNMELARVEASFSGLAPGKHGWSINEYGDLTRGAASTGKIFSPTNQETAAKPLGDLGTLDADEKGEAFFSGVVEKLKVGDLIGRAIVVYRTDDKSEPGISAAVVARSAGVGENYKKLCTCDGTTIWESTNSDYVTSQI